MGLNCLLSLKPSILALLVKSNHLRKCHQLLPIYVLGRSKGAHQSWPVHLKPSHLEGGSLLAAFMLKITAGTTKIEKSKVSTLIHNSNSSLTFLLFLHRICRGLLSSEVQGQRVGSPVTPHP